MIYNSTIGPKAGFNQLSGCCFKTVRPHSRLCNYRTFHPKVARSYWATLTCFGNGMVIHTIQRVSYWSGAIQASCHSVTASQLSGILGDRAQATLSSSASRTFQLFAFGQMRLGLTNKPHP